jgi:uncharacterized protein
VLLACLLRLVFASAPAHAQIPPSKEQIANYKGLFADAAKGEVVGIALALATGTNPDIRDEDGRTPLIVAAYRKQYSAALALFGGKADPNAMERQRYDIVTIAAVQDDPIMLKIALEHGASAKNITSPYRGTALIAAAHLGHVDIVRALIAAGAPLDHINDLGWTALSEAILLGDGGKNHQETVRALVEAGAKLDIADKTGATPLMLAKKRKFKEIAAILESAGAK